MVRTNPRLRQYQYPHHYPQHHQQRHQQQQQQYQLPRFHSEESLASRGYREGIYSSRIHSSADEISSLNRSPSMSSSDESFSRTDFSSRTDAEEEAGQSVTSSPPSRPPSHAPWIYPSDIQIDPSSLEVSPKMERRPLGAVGGQSNSKEKPKNKAIQLPSVGHSPSPTVNKGGSVIGAAKRQQAAASREAEFRSEVESELDFESNLEDEDGAGENLCDRLDLPHGVKGVEESCRSAMSYSDIGDSCGSFEFLSGNRPTASSRRRKTSNFQEDSIQEETADDGCNGEDEDDEDKLFLPVRSAQTGLPAGERSFDEAQVLKQIQELSAAALGSGTAESATSNNSRKSSRSNESGGGGGGSRRSGSGSDRSGRAKKGGRKVSHSYIKIFRKIGFDI